ncbi:MAG: hypothetical protein MJZ62_03850 [Bacteroidales bacterium]|nr:hypothetical protein [Bacteroidales bacterium]
MNDETIFDNERTEVYNNEETTRSEEPVAAKEKSNNGKKIAIAAAAVAGAGAIVGGTAYAMNTHGGEEQTEEVEASVMGQAAPAPAGIVSDDMSFNEAFASAREQVGPYGVFEWHGKVYGTYMQDEWEKMTPEERMQYNSAVEQRVAQYHGHAQEEELTPAVSTSAEESQISNSAAMGANSHTTHVHIHTDHASQATSAAHTSAPVAHHYNDVEYHGTAPMADNVNDSMSFSQAFASARSEVGAGGVFEWHGKLYGTYYETEWNSMSSAERAAYNESVFGSHGTANMASNNDDIEVEVIGVAHNVTIDDDVQVDVASLNVGGVEAVVVDADQDGYVDVLVVDENGNSVVDDNEVYMVPGSGVEMPQGPEMTIDNYSEVGNDMAYNGMDDSGMPDYMNDASIV